MSNLQIRRALESEAFELSGLAIAAKRHWNYSDAQIEAWRADLNVSATAVSKHPTFLAERDGRIAGFYSLIASVGNWELEHLWVLPEFSRQGIGRALLDHAALTAVSAGVTAIVIDADPNAEPFYLACGALRVGAVFAPIAGQPDRVRPQLRLPVQKI